MKNDLPTPRKWYSVSFGMKLLLATLILFNLACVIQPVLLDITLRRLDIRLWPSWFIITLAGLVLALVPFTFSPRQS